MILFFQVNKNFKISPSVSFFFFLFPTKKELVAGLLLCQINTSGCRLTLEREWRSQLWQPREDMGAPTGWPATLLMFSDGGRNWKQYRRGKHLGMCIYWKAVCQSMNYARYNILLPIYQVNYRNWNSKLLKNIPTECKAQVAFFEYTVYV